MEGNYSPKASAWGAPAIGAQIPNANSSQGTPEDLQMNQTSNCKQMPSHHHRFQRPGPYHNSPRGRNIQNNNIIATQNKNDSPGLLDSPEKSLSPANPYHSKGQRFSSDNPYQSQKQNFSADNPFQNKGQGQNFSSENPFQNKGQNLSSSNPFQESGSFHSPNRFPSFRPRFQSSPYSRSPRGSNSNYSPRTPSRNYSSSGNSRGFHSHPRSSFSSLKRPYGQQNRSMNNPGGSENIRDYIHPSMMENPWKDLPATPMLQSY